MNVIFSSTLRDFLMRQVYAFFKRNLSAHGHIMGSHVHKMLGFQVATSTVSGETTAARQLLVSNSLESNDCVTVGNAMA